MSIYRTICGDEYRKEFFQQKSPSITRAFRMIAIAVVLVFAIPSCFAQQQSTRGVIAPSGVERLSTLEQNWTDTKAEWFYNAPQGSKLVPFSWFVSLEQPDTTDLILTTANISKLGYIPRAADPLRNPLGLPVGFVHDGTHLGITCAACHTGVITYKNNAWLIDGAPSMADFETFLRQLAESLEKTATATDKFGRFATRVLGPNATTEELNKLKDELKNVAAFRKGYNDRNSSRSKAKAYGPGRIDAFGAIFNEVSATFAKLPNNHFEADAPVSYPFLWDTPQHDFVQWNGAAENKTNAFLEPIIGTKHFGALGRNIGEVLGVFGTLDASHEGTIAQFKGYSSSVNKDSLINIEETVRDLWSPKWPTATFPIDSALVEQGKSLFKRDCQHCHNDAFVRDDPKRRVVAAMSDVKTDQQMIRNTLLSAKTGVLEGRQIGIKPGEKFGDTAPRAKLLRHMVQRALFYRQTALPIDLVDPIQFLQSIDGDSDWDVHADIRIGDITVSGQFDSLSTINGLSDLSSKKAVDFLDKKGSKIKQDLNSLVHTKIPSLIGRLKRSEEAPAAPEPQGVKPEIAFKYKARPLNGIWATAPYLHNGSVPNLDELLKPASQRVKKFKVGSREFDPVKVGFVDEGSFEFDTSVVGNSNLGHDDYKKNGEEYSADERQALIEYMKTL